MSSRERSDPPNHRRKAANIEHFGLCSRARRLNDLPDERGHHLASRGDGSRERCPFLLAVSALSAHAPHACSFESRI